MGILGKLFDKKECDICGGEIGMLGNRKLSDGNLCKQCASKLSPFMTDRRQSTVEEIRQHLAYREANAKLLQTIHPTTALGGYTKVYVDEAAGKFFVSRSKNWRDENPDVIDFNQVIDVRTEVTEHRTQEYHRDREGKNVPFVPPRYRYSYEFETTIMVDSPYFSEIQFELTEQRPEARHSDAYRYYEEMADAIRDAICPAYGAKTVAPTASTLAQAVANIAAAAQAVAAKPVTAAQAGIQSEEGGLPIIIISDGTLMKSNLKRQGYEQLWLQKQLSRYGLSSPEQVFLLTVDELGRTYCVKKEDSV